MRTLILAAGHLGGAEEIAAGRAPRLDVFELQAALGAELLDYKDVDASSRSSVRAVKRALGASAALAMLASKRLRDYDAVLTTGEDVGVPLAALQTGHRRGPAHTMIAHTLTPWKKRLFFHLLRVQGRIDRFLCYATSEERNMVDRLGIPAAKVSRIAFHADTRFFRPMPEVAVEPDLVCSAGQLLRDYDCLVDACQDLPVRVSIAAASPWITKELRPNKPLPRNVQWGRYQRFELRALYARSACAVVPLYENDYQTGISTILEMMAMGKCVIATRTRGQTDTIVDGVNGLYVAPGDRKALRDAVQWVLGHPADAARIGKAARRFIEENASLDLFVSRIADSVRAAAAQIAAG